MNGILEVRIFWWHLESPPLKIGGKTDLICDNPDELATRKFTAIKGRDWLTE